MRELAEKDGLEDTDTFDMEESFMSVSRYGRVVSRVRYQSLATKGMGRSKIISKGRSKSVTSR